MEDNFVNVSLSKEFFFEKATSSGNMPSLHAHAWYEIFYLTSGTRKYFINNKYYQLKAGDIACISPNAPHKTGGDSGQRFLINFSQSFIDKFITKHGQNALFGFFNRLFLRPLPNVQNTLLDLFNALNVAYTKNDTDSIVNSLFKLFSILNDSPALQNENSYAIKQLHNIMQYVQANYEHITCLDDVANALFVSKYYICHLFSKHLEVPFNGYLTQIRLKKAEQLLKTTRLSVYEISLKCGFNSSAYFGAVFKKTFNVTPLNYREISYPKYRCRSLKDS